MRRLVSLVKLIPAKQTARITYKILKVAHKSSRTLWSLYRAAVSFGHNRLTKKYRWYERWHRHPYHRHAHYAALAVYVLATLMVLTGPAHKTYANGLAAPVSDSSEATILNTTKKIYFDSGATYHANVAIDNYTRQMSGYAWSEDMGWIDFGSDSDNSLGPVVADKTGHLTGRAKAINGGYIDFGTNSANVVITTPGGDFSGYAWSEDLGWIDFAGVSAPDYNPDLLAPDNPATVTAKSAAGGTTLTNNHWYNYHAPYFSWTAPADHADGITPSGAAGYYIYFGTDAAADPSDYQVTNDFTSPSIDATGSFTYYLRIKTKDVAGNVSDPVTIFTYKYENLPPTPPSYVAVNPSGYSRTNSFTFSWPVSGGTAATDTGGSNVAGYRYLINSDGNWHAVSGDANTATVALTDVASLGLNTFDLEAVDGAGNVSFPVRTNFYFNNSSPTAPRNLSVNPPGTSSTNSFAFSWDAPPGDVAGYYYSVNSLPTDSNSSFTTETSLDAGPYATQQGENTFYIVARDSSGAYDLSSCNNISGNPAVDGCAKVSFSAVTIAPGIPGSIQVYDISDRAAKDYATAVKWVEPEDKGTGGFAGYDVYRSTDGNNYAKVGSTTGSIYADGNLNSQKYYYYVKSKDSAGKFSAATSPVSLTPTGRYTSPPKLVSGPTVTVAPTSITVKWATDRDSSSFVQIKDGNTFVSEQGQTAQTTSHEVKVVGLRSQRSYSFSIRSTDVDGNILEGSDQNFKTANTPSVYSLNVSNITQSSAIVNFKSTAIADFALYYGDTANYGQEIDENSSGGTTNHSIALSGLKPGQAYYFRVTGEDADGNELRSENSFSTLPMPAISKFGIQPDTSAPSTTIKVSWETNVPTSSIVKYSVDGKTFREQSVSDLTTDHEISISDLSDQSKYVIYASGRDQFGNEARSDQVSYDTPADTRPPKISDIVIESSNVGNSTNKSQVAVSWKTDEPANSQVEYDVGLSGSEYTRKTSLDSTSTNRHLVIISGLDPGKPYHIRIHSADPAGNLSESGDNTVITGEVSHSALQIIANTMQNIFGWMGKLFK
jgi:hypothetical protein